MRCSLWILLGLLGIATRAYGQSICDQSEQTYLGLLEKNAIYPISETIKQRISPFASAQFVNSHRSEASSGSQTARLVEMNLGSVSGQTDGDDVALTLRIESIKVESSEQGNQQLSKPLGDGTVRIVLSPFGVLRAASVSGPGVDPSNPTIRSLVEAFRAAFGDLAKLPENGIRQDQSISAASQFGGMLRLQKMTARGQGIYRHRPVLVFDIVGDMLRIQDSKHVGHFEGFEFIDRATGIWVVYETDGSLEDENSGQIVEVKSHICEEIRF